MSRRRASDGEPPRRSAAFRATSARAAQLAAAGVLGLLLASRLMAIQTVAFNWDEFALLSHAQRTAATGILHGGGRPGLATLVLLPFARGCQDEIAALREARLLWLAFTAAFLAGLALLLARIGRRGRRPAADAALGVGLLAGVPAFLEWSIQVRSDQIALAAGVWGGLALLASRRRPAWAVPAGLLFATGYLATQKLVYAGALMGLLAAADLWRDRALRPRRELVRAALCGATALGIVAAFHWTRAAGAGPGPPGPGPGIGAGVRHGLSVFAFYRETIGYSQYAAMLPTLIPHLALAVLLVAASAAALRARARPRDELLLAWAVLALGLAVGLFHAGAFAYFWMTLGLFPAVAFAVSREALLSPLAPLAGRTRALLAAAFALALALPAALQIADHLRDTQSVQARSLALVHRNFAAADRGFQPESALFCRPDPEPFPIFFSQRIYREFAGPRRAENAARLIRAFEEKPVKFVVDSWRLRQFPEELRRFWDANYQPYRDAVRIAGRRLAGARGERVDFELIVPGPYRWLPAAGPQEITVDGVAVPAGHVIELARGAHSAELRDAVPFGMLVLALHEPPGPAAARFYKSY